jgi:vacuolar-type H+-ATPase subunit H
VDIRSGDEPMNKPGTDQRPRESREQFAQRIAREMREGAREILANAERDAKKLRQAASKLDGKRS